MCTHFISCFIILGNLALGGFICLNLQLIAQNNAVLGNMIQLFDIWTIAT